MNNQEVQLPKDPGDPELYYKILDDFETQLSQNKRYLEAEFVKHKKIEVQAIIEQNMTQDLSTQQKDEQKFIQKSFDQELQNFNDFWLKKFQEFQIQTENLEAALIEKQKEDFQEIKLQLVESIPNQYKESRELIQMREHEKFLCQNKDYVEAHFVTLKIKELEEIEYNKHKGEVQTMIQAKLEQIRFKQQKELKILKDKIQQGKEEQETARIVDHQKLMKKFQNIKNDLQMQQQGQKNKLEKTFISGQLNESRLNESKLILNSSKMNDSRLILNQSKILSPEKSRIKY